MSNFFEWRQLSLRSLLDGALVVSVVAYGIYTEFWGTPACVSNDDYYRHWDLPDPDEFGHLNDVHRGNEDLSRGDELPIIALDYDQLFSGMDGDSQHDCLY